MPDQDLDKVQNFAIFIIGIVVMVFVAVLVLAAIAASNSSRQLLTYWASVVTALLIPIALLGFFLGKGEARSNLKTMELTTEFLSRGIAPLLGATIRSYDTLEKTAETRAKRLAEESERGAVQVGPLGTSVSFDDSEIIDGQAKRLDL